MERMCLFKDRLCVCERARMRRMVGGCVSIAVDGGRVCVYLRVCVPVSSVGRKGRAPLFQGGMEALVEGRGAELCEAALPEDHPPGSPLQTCALCLTSP